MLKNTQSVVIGDVQGCSKTLSQLLALCRGSLGAFDVYFVGDLVNRGAHSLSVLEQVRGAEFNTVLGNHELYVLGVVAGAMRRRSDTLDNLFESPQFMDWVEWLRFRPILLELDDHLVVHAGVHPDWTRAEVMANAERIEHGLRSDQWKQFLKGIMGHDITDHCTANALQIFTRMRMLTEGGGFDARYKGAPEDAPDGLTPWYELYRGQAGRIIFGHWAALGARQLSHGVSLDTGCVWGRKLTGYALPNGQLISCSVVESDLMKH